MSTVAIATLAVFAGGGGLGEKIFGEGVNFKTNIIIAGGIAILMALAFDVILFAIQRRPHGGGWPERDRTPLPPPAGSLGGAIEFIFNPQTSNVTGGKRSAASTRWSNWR